MNKKVSVIIPFYNGVEWLSEAVQSVLNQTYNNIEIIVINDGSPENIDGFLKKFGDKIIYKYKENGGAATARNLAWNCKLILDKKLSYIFNNFVFNFIQLPKFINS